MAKRARKTKYDRYLETRLWNWKEKGCTNPLSSQQLMAELRHYFGLKTSNRKFRSKLMKKIRRARERVSKRWNRWQKNRKLWAEMLGVDEKKIEKMLREKLINNKRDVERLARCLKIMGRI
ncbi:MAG TPA: hypothetical protein ENG51_23925 [Deltaproteobacteria bacterium]|nr:hypothetical protein [Deltaproteobacteria bacterium]